MNHTHGDNVWLVLIGSRGEKQIPKLNSLINKQHVEKGMGHQELTAIGLDLVLVRRWSLATSSCITMIPKCTRKDGENSSLLKRHSFRGGTYTIVNRTHGSKVGDMVGDNVLFPDKRKRPIMPNLALDGHNHQNKKLRGVRTHGATVGLIVGSKVGDMVGDNVLFTEKREKSNYAQFYDRSS